MAAKRTAPKPPTGTLVLFVRHGQTPTTGATLPGRAPGLHLSDAGTAQAAKTAERIAALHTRRPVAAVYASPLERARETAAPIAQRLALRTRTHRGLLECDFGDWTGQELKALMKRAEWGQVQRYPSGFRFPGGESFTEMQARITGAVADLRARHPNGTVVAVSHADPIKAAVAHATGTHLDLFQRLVISPCSITAVLYTDATPIVLTVNATDDLAGLAPS